MDGEGWRRIEECDGRGRGPGALSKEFIIQTVRAARARIGKPAAAKGSPWGENAAGDDPAAGEREERVG